MINTKMLYYDRIDTFEVIDVNKRSESKDMTFATIDIF